MILFRVCVLGWWLFCLLGWVCFFVDESVSYYSCLVGVVVVGLLVV